MEEVIAINNEIRDFNKDAASWDQESRRVKLANDVGNAITNAVKLDAGMDVLDFGCGSGLLTLRLQPLVRSITGIDSSQGMIDVLNDKVETGNIINVKTKCLDLAKGDVLEDRYSLIVSSMTFHHIDNIEHLLEYFYKLLVPGGYLCIADLDPDGGQFHDSGVGVFHCGFDRQALCELFIKAGFMAVHDQTAATVTKTSGEGKSREFSVFIMAGCKEVQ